MATLALSRDLLTDFAKLEKATQAKVHQLAGQFQQMTAQELRSSKGIHLEAYQGARDPRARTIRIDENRRGIVIDAGNDEMFVLTRILTHSDADRWMTSNEFRVNEATSAFEIVDVSALEAAIRDAVDSSLAAPGEPPLFHHRRDREFAQLGVSVELLPAIRAFTSEDQLLSFLLAVPPGQAEALMLLLGDESTDELYTQLAGSTPAVDATSTDLVAAVTSPASRSQFHIVTDESQLAEVLSLPLAQWRIYLHPSQRQLVERAVYNGPVRVTGGAGTGKTVVAMHRARSLAADLNPGGGRRVLFTTFTTNLADAIEHDLRTLGGAELLERVEVINVDKLANRIVTEAEGARPGVATGDTVRDLWVAAASELALDLSPEFLAAEWEQVVLAQGVASQADYLKVPRSGRGRRLDRKGRIDVWRAVELVTSRLAQRNARTFLQLAGDAAGYLNARPIKPYDHIVVDEAQDLHETQWRLLRAAVTPGPNDLFLVGDSHQRIYDRRTSLSKVGIEVRGRSRRLRINYRTTAEILRWSLSLLGHGDYDDLDDGIVRQGLSEYHSFLRGSPPTTVGSRTRKAQLDALVAHVQHWVDGGVDEDDIAVAVRREAGIEGVVDALKAAGFSTVVLKAGVPAAAGVRVATMHRLKGVEFRCVAVVDADDENVPNRWALTDVADDPQQHELDLRRERCLLYVACTRAREDLWVGWTGTPSRFLPGEM